MKDIRLGNLRPTSLTMADLLDMRELVMEALSLYEDNGADAAENLANTLGNAAQGDPHHSMDAFMAQKTLAEYLAGQLAFVQTSYGVIEMEV